MNAGQYYGFNKTFRDPDTSYPHKNNDLVVKEQFKKGTSDTHENQAKMYKDLAPFSKSSLHELFASDRLEVENDGKVYVPEGTNCNSFGILRIKNEPFNINVEIRTKGRKPKISFKDRNETFINPSYTGDDVVTKECFDLQIDVLMIVGFGRPWEGNKKIPFPIKRCYLIAVGIVYRNYLSYQIEAAM